MYRRTPRSTLTDPLFPYTTLCRAAVPARGRPLPRRNSLRPLRDVVELACLRGRPARLGHRIVIHFVLSPDILAGPGKRPRARGAIVESRTASAHRSEEHTSELQSLMRISSAVFCLQKKNNNS